VRALFTRSLNLIWLQNLALLSAVTLVAALLPLAVRQAGYSDSTNGLVMGVSALGMLAALLVSGRLIDRGSPRRYLALGALLWAVTSALLALSGSLAALVICRLAQGFAYALFYTATVVCATRSVRDELRGTVVGIIEAVGALAIAGAPFLAFPLGESWGYPAVFGLAAVLSGAAGLSVALLPDPPPAPVDPSTQGPVRLLSAHALVPGLVAACLFSVASAYINLAPLIAQRVGAASLSLYMGLRAGGTVPTRLLSGYLADRKGPAWVVAPGFLMAMLAICLLPFVAKPGLVYLVPLLFGLGMGLVSPALTAWMLKSTPPGERAVAVNTFSILAEGSGFFSSWLAGAFLQSGSLRGFLWLAALLAVGLALFGVKARERRAAVALGGLAVGNRGKQWEVPPARD
jgi:MFS family permease